MAGTVSQPVKVDLHGWSASLAVDNALFGDVRIGETLKIAWEELSSARRVRFEDGNRIVVVLDPLPGQSLWRKRFPRTRGAPEVFVVASHGDAFLRDPDGTTVSGLEHYLAMTPQAREGGPGTKKLAEIAASANPAVAAEALELLEARPQVVELLGADGADFLLRAARNTDRDVSIRSAALAFAAKHALPGTRETALALAQPDSAIRADAYRALALLSGGMSSEQVERLLADPDADLRVAGVEIAGPALHARVTKLAQHDASPRVRLAAARALLTRNGTAAIPDVIELLDDSDGSVRSAVGASIGALGKDAVEPLRAVVEKGSERAAFAAIVGLSRAGKEGGVALYFISTNHANEKVRTFAGMAIGKPAPHDD